MPDPQYISIRNRKIAYYMSSGTGPVLFFIHGNSCSSNTFNKQLTGRLGRKYRVIAFDLPGHGNSEPAADLSTYSLSGYGQLVAELAIALQLRDIFLVGCSLGGHIALQASSLVPNLLGIAIFGTPPLDVPLQIEDKFYPTNVVDYVFAPTLNMEEAISFASLFFSHMPEPDNTDISLFVEDILMTHPDARPRLGDSIASGNYLDEVDIVSKLPVPLAIIHGAQEQIVIAEYFKSLSIPSLWRNHPQIVKDAGHLVQWEQPTAFDNLLDQFATDVSKP